MITIKLAVMVKMMIMVQMAIEFYLNFIQISGEPGPFTTAKNGQSFLNHMKTIIEINNVDSTLTMILKLTLTPVRNLQSSNSGTNM